MYFARVLSLFAPFFPTEAEKRHISTTTVGLIISSYQFIMVFGTFASGKLTNHFGLKFMIGGGVFLTGGAVILFGFLDYIYDATTYTILAFAIRIVQALGACKQVIFFCNFNFENKTFFISFCYFVQIVT